MVVFWKSVRSILARRLAKGFSEKRKKEKKKKVFLSSFLREKTEKGKPGERKRAEIGIIFLGAKAKSQQKVYIFTLLPQN